MSISRIDAEKNHTHGFYVRVSIGGVLHSKFFQDGKWGGTQAARAAAEEHEAVLFAQRGPKSEQRPNRRNTSGVTGVSRTIEARNGLASWRASWMEDGRQRSLGFAVNKYGEEEARQMAVEARRARVQERESLSYRRHCD